MKSIRNDLGDKIEFMIDVMQAWVPHPYDFYSALKLARGLEENNVIWLEEPLPHYNNPELSARLCQSVNIEIAGGVAMSGWPAYKHLLEKGAPDIVQPDVQYAGGISEVRKIAFLAEAYGKRCIPHFFYFRYCSGSNAPCLQFNKFSLFRIPIPPTLHYT